MRKNRSAKRKRLRQKRKESRVLAPVEAVASQPPKKRLAIVHYHLFKNAGSSVDAILQASFGDRYGTHEFAPTARGADAVAGYLDSRPELAVLSTHTALLPAPQHDGLSIFPILFLRHPIDRLRSAYTFERTQRADTAGAALARENDFAGYLRALLGRKGTQARNFQTARLAFNEPSSQGSQLERGLRAVAFLPFLGLVECFDQSIECLSQRIKAVYPEFTATSTHRNASAQANLTLTEKLAAIEREIGPDLYKEICDANEDDMLIFRRLAGRYGLRGDFD